MIFFIGIHHPGKAKHFATGFISVNAVRGRIKPIACDNWILDSGAFSEILRFGRFRHDPADYAAEVNRLAAINSGLTIAVSQDYMCEPAMLERTGLTVQDHQNLTIERYDALRKLITVPLMPVLQGYSVGDYLSHIDQYGARLEIGAYVGVGSICKRNANVAEVEGILLAIKRKRPDLRLHGFGLKITALRSGIVRDRLYSADSMAWSFAARKQGRDPECWKEAQRFIHKVERQAIQLGWEF